MQSFDEFIESLANEPIQSRPAKARETYLCGQCGGTWQRLPITKRGF